MPNNSIIPVGTTPLALSENAAVGDELGRSGLAFGDLVKRTGQAIADTQNKLNSTAATTASALATTLVDVIALQEKVYDDQGTLTDINNHTSQLPLINFIDPVVYQWSRVHLQGLYFAREWASASERQTESHVSSGGAGQGGLLLILGAGYNYNKQSDVTSQSTQATTSDYAVGQMRMNALLEPRKDIGVPKPIQVIQGPYLSIVAGEIQPVMDGGRLVARTMSVLVEYHRRDGTAIPGKIISVETDGVPWAYVTTDGQTDNNGRVEITLRRDFLDEDADTSPQDTVVSTRIGMVQNNTTVTF
jgi:hypothetical protein